MRSPQERLIAYSSTAGRVLLSFVFLYFGLDGIFHPTTWSHLVPGFLSGLIPATLLVTVHGTVEIICALLIIGNVYTQYAASLLALIMLVVIALVSGPTQVRDIGVLSALLMLISQSISRTKPA